MIKASILKWCKDPDYEHINGQYGVNFADWLKKNGNLPGWNSMGNGSAMRVGAAGWLYDSLEETLEYARYTSEVSHTHPEGIKGAQATAAVIYLARTGKSKEEIKEYISKTFNYDLNRTVAHLQQNYCPYARQSETCPTCVPEAIICFLEADSYEDAVRNAVSIGGDTDTIACIAGSMAEAMYGVPAKLKEKARSYIDDKMKLVTERMITMRTGRKVACESDFDESNVSPMTFINHLKESGDIGYDFFIERMRDQVDLAPTELGRDYAALAKKAVETGYPLGDIELLWQMKQALNAADLKTPAQIQAKDHAEAVFNDIINNTKDGVKTPLNAKDRIDNINSMMSALDAFTSTFGTGMNKTAIYVNDIVKDTLYKRLDEGLTPAERALMADNLEEAYRVLDVVDPSKMRSSSEFRNMKSAFKRLLAYAKDMDVNNPADIEKYNNDKKKLLTLAKKYIKYKRGQNKGLHIRSEIELNRVAVVDALIYKLSSEDGLKPKQEGYNADINKQLYAARKYLFEGRNVLKSAAILSAEKELKSKGQAVTIDSLKNKSQELLDNKDFVASIGSLNSRKLEDMIDRGAMSEHIKDVKAANDYQKNRSAIWAEWKRVRAQKERAYKVMKNQTAASGSNKTEASGNNKPKGDEKAVNKKTTVVKTTTQNKTDKKTVKKS